MFFILMFLNISAKHKVTKFNRNDHRKLFQTLKTNFDSIFSSYTPENFFQLFMENYNKKYSSEEETKYRFNQIKENAERIYHFNKKHNDLKLGITPFIDMSFNEFKYFYLMDEETTSYLQNKATKRRREQDAIISGNHKENKIIFPRYDSRMLQGFPNMTSIRDSIFSSFTSPFQQDQQSSSFMTAPTTTNWFQTPDTSSFNSNQDTSTTQSDYNTNTRNEQSDNTQTTATLSDDDQTSTKTGDNQTRYRRGGFSYPKRVFKDFMEAHKLINKRRYNISDYARYINWTEARKVTPVRDQKRCASCYAFSAIANIESLSLIHQNMEYNLSEQEIIDCSYDYYNEGCKGGLQAFTIDYIMDNGITAEKNYPYADQEQRCYKNRRNRIYYDKLDYIYLDNNVMALIAALNYGPATMAFIATPDFFRYNRGVIDESVCNTDIKTPNHSTLVVGYDLDAKVPHFIVKNSWSSDWGEDGYFRIKIGSLSTNNTGLCGLASFDINTMGIIVE